jgi:uncharacterized protein YndB with AHSA1/START domain
MKWVWRILGSLAALAGIAVVGLLLAGLRTNHGRNSATIEIARPVAQVWRYLSTDELTKKWVSGLEEIRHLTPGIEGAGEKLYLVETYENERVAMEMTIERFEAPHHIAFTLVGLGDPSQGFTERGEYLLAEQNGTTRLTLSGTTVYNGFLPRLFEPLITPAAQKKLEEDLHRLKQLVESESPSPISALLGVGLADPRLS